MAGSGNSGVTKLDTGLGRVGVPLQSVTLATLVIGGWQARGYLEEQLRAMESMRAAIEEIRHDGQVTKSQASEQAKALADSISEASEQLRSLRDRVDAHSECLELRRKNPRAECDT